MEEVGVGDRGEVVLIEEVGWLDLGVKNEMGGGS